MRSRRSGFTLIEIMVAIAVGGLAMIAARAIVEATTSFSQSIARSAIQADITGNGERLLRSSVEQIESSSDAGKRFSGTGTQASFATWCIAPGGWPERCRGSIAIVTMRDSSAIYLRLDGQVPIKLRSTSGSAGLRYLNDPSNGGEWFATWNEGVTVPLAIALLAGTDTLILRIGERG